ncbi:MAG: DUF4321 domain-containing protein [Nitrospirota bacterium]|jgi:hypothetical protein
MPFLKRNFWIFLVFILLGGLLGSILGEILGIVAPDGPLRSIFLKGFRIGIDPPFTLNLRIITFTIGFTFSINLMSILGMIIGMYLYKQS